MKGKMGDRQRLLHILEAISEIEKYTSQSNINDFASNSMMRFASVKQIEIIGEAANFVSADTKTQFPQVEWRQIIGLRHILVHEYFGIDTALIWQIISTDIPKLKGDIETIVSYLDKID